MKAFLLTLSLLFASHLFVSPLAVADKNFELDDLISPNQIAAELGLPPVEDSLVSIQSVESISAREGVDILREWPIVIWVNKAAAGATAQHLKFWYRGRLYMDALISTGRERMETPKKGEPYFSSTPVGWFNPTRLVEDHYSELWQTNMPFAIFFNGGIALHATHLELYPQLGQRASGGCVRQREENAERIFWMVYHEPKTTVPAFTRDGKILRDRSGNIKRKRGSGTLIIVEDQP